MCGCISIIHFRDLCVYLYLSNITSRNISSRVYAHICRCISSINFIDIFCKRLPGKKYLLRYMPIYAGASPASTLKITRQNIFFSGISPFIYAGASLASALSIYFVKYNQSKYIFQCICPFIYAGASPVSTSEIYVSFCILSNITRQNISSKVYAHLYMQVQL